MKEQPELAIHEVPVKDLVPYAHNAKLHSERQVDTIAASISEFGMDDPIAVWHNAEGEKEIIEGHGRVMALKKLGIETAPVIYLDHLTDEQRRAYTHVHNQTTLNSGFDMEILESDIEQLDFDWESFGFGAVEKLDGAGIDFSKQEGMSAHTDEYDEFVSKFEPKKTTDDCYTPSAVYDAVKNWAFEEYGLEGREIVRPFYPGGDYERFDYPDGCVVIDNPPFSILSEILRFYNGRGIDYFLFAPALTSLKSDAPCHVYVSADIEYENGAKVRTAFLTSLQDEAARTAPALNEALKCANDDASELPKYSYPDNLLTASDLMKICRGGVAFSVGYGVKISALDVQKDIGKAVYGGGMLISDQDAKAKADAIAEAELAISRRLVEKTNWCGRQDEGGAVRFELSEREREIVEGIGKPGKRPTSGA